MNTHGNENDEFANWALAKSGATANYRGLLPNCLIPQEALSGSVTDRFSNQTPPEPGFVCRGSETFRLSRSRYVDNEIAG